MTETADVRARAEALSEAIAYGVYNDRDIEDIARALLVALDQRDAALKLHVRAGQPSRVGRHLCEECIRDWPCPTVRALGGES